MLEGLELGDGPPCDCEKTDTCNKIRRLLPHQGTTQRQKENFEELKQILTEGGVSLATKICIGKGELKTVFRTVLEEFPNGTEVISGHKQNMLVMRASAVAPLRRWLPGGVQEY